MKMDNIELADDSVIFKKHDNKGNYIAICTVINLNPNFECYHTYVNGKNYFFDLVGEHIEDPDLDQYTKEEMDLVKSSVEELGGVEKILEITKEKYKEFSAFYKDSEFDKQLKEMGKLN